MTSLRSRTVAAVLLAASVTACSGGDDPAVVARTSSATPDATPDASSAPSGGVVVPDTPTPGTTDPGRSDPEPPFPADTARDTGEPFGEPQTVVEVRAARQDGYDRVVFELRGKDGTTGGPGWWVEYVDKAVQDGSGDEVEVAGNTVLQVFVEGVGLPFDTGQEEASTDLVPRDTAAIREVDLSATFEGRFTTFIGLDERLPFRVFRLSNPSRVVVDVRHR